MRLVQRRKHSQRSMKAIEVKFMPNYAGQDGLDCIILESTEHYFTLYFDSKAEVTSLLSQAHIVSHNFPEKK